jgi:hypothetical protein
MATAVRATAPNLAEASKGTSSSSSVASSGTTKDDEEGKNDEQFGIPWGMYGFLGFIGLVVAWFYRSNRERHHLKLLEDAIEAERSIAPNEITALKSLNSITPEQFERICTSVVQRCRERGSFQARSADFFGEVVAEHPDVFPGGVIRGGHYIERLLFVLEHLYGETKMAVQAQDGERGNMAKRGAASETPAVGNMPGCGDPDALLDVKLLLVVLSMVVNGTPEERAASLFRLTSLPDGDGYATGGRSSEGVDPSACESLPREEPTVTAAQVIAMTEHLRRTYQFPIEFLTETVKGVRFPMKQYTRASSAGMFRRADEEMLRSAPEVHRKHDPEALAWIEWTEASYVPTWLDVRRLVWPRPEAPPLKQLDLEQFTQMLLNKPLCAWGQCFKRRGRGRVSTSESPTDSDPEATVKPVNERAPMRNADDDWKAVRPERKDKVFFTGDNGERWFGKDGEKPQTYVELKADLEKPDEEPDGGL